MIPKPSGHIVVRIILFSFLLAVPVKLLQAQSVRYEFEEVPYTKEFEGFSGNCIIQDSEGFMWFGSENGLYRYDGASFISYVYNPLRNNASPDDYSGLVEARVYSLIEDTEGTLWFGNYGVLTCFDRKTETFRHFPDTFINAPIPCVLEGKDGYLWVGSDAGLSRFDIKTGTFKNFPAYKSELPGSERNPVYKIYEDSMGNLWIRHLYGGISIFNRQTEAFENIKNAPPCVHNFLEDRSGRFWVVSQDGLYQFDRKSGTFQRYLYLPDDPDRLTNQDVVNILQDDMGHFWLNTYDGIYQYDENLKKLNFLRYPGINTLKWKYYSINTTRLIYIDHKGTIWFFSMNEICRLIKRFNNFTVYEPGEAADSMSNFMHTENSVLMCTRARTRDELYAGIYMLNRETHKSTKLLVDPRHKIEDFGFAITDHKGTLWIATKGRGLYRGIVSEDGRIKFENVFSQSGDSANLPGLFLYRLFEDSRGRIWIEVRGHLPCYYDREQDRIIHLINNPNSKDKLPDITGLELSQGCVQSETNSGILLASNKFHGIYAIIPPYIKVSENAVMPTDIIQFRSVSGDEAILGEEMYQSSLDSIGIIWTRCGFIGFQKLILKKHNGKDDFIVHSKIYKTEDGLLHNYVHRFLEDDHGNFWLATWNGLSKFDPSTEKFTNFTIQDSLPTLGFNSSALKSNDGEMFLCTDLGGFISFYPDSIRYNNQIPPVMLTELKINQQSISPRESPILEKLVTYSDFIELSYNQNNISFGYAALNYIQPGRNQYKYKLEGFNDEWIYAGNRTSVDYNNMKPGRYAFRVKGSNNDGIWNEEGASLKIIIHPPPWKTVWAYIIYGFVLIGIILWYRRFLLNRAQIKTALEVERVEKEKVQELDHMKSRFFANISHEFRTPLTLILGPLEDFVKKKSRRIELTRDLISMMHRNAKRLQQLINQLLDLSKLETGKVKLQVAEGNLEEFVRTIILSFLSLAERKHIQYTHDLPETSLKVYFDNDKVEKVLTNLISNAFKFTPEHGKINVILQYITSAETEFPQFAEIKVSDTGKGIPEEQLDKIFDRFYQVSDSDTRDAEGTGIGLALTRELVNLYRGEISVESKVGKGSTFRVKFPVSKEQFKEEEIVTITPDDEMEKAPIVPGIIPEEPEMREMNEKHTG